MEQPIHIYWTTGSLDEARKVCRYLVQEKIVACAQIIPWIESIYTWNGQVETAQESKVIIKSDLKYFEAVKEVIKSNCTYEIPEILYEHIDGGNEEYLNWMNGSMKNLV